LHGADHAAAQGHGHAALAGFKLGALVERVQAAGDADEKLLYRHLKLSVLCPSVIGQERRFAFAALFGKEKNARCARLAARWYRSAAGAAVVHKGVKEHHKKCTKCKKYNCLFAQTLNLWEGNKRSKNSEGY
jgi:hypothetical protein